MFQRSNRILLIDTDNELVPLLADFLRLEGFETLAAHSNLESISYIKQQSYDVLITDIETNSFGIKSFLAERLAVGSTKPVLFFSAMNNEETQATGLVLPIDSVVQKPCPPKRLGENIRNLLSKSQKEPTTSAPIVVGPLVIHPNTHTLEADGLPMDLTTTEFMLLEVLASNVNQPVRKDEIYHKVLGRPMHANDRAIDVHVSAVRHKLASVLDKTITIESVRGVGYQLMVRA